MCCDPAVARRGGDPRVRYHGRPAFSPRQCLHESLADRGPRPSRSPSGPPCRVGRVQLRVRAHGHVARLRWPSPRGYQDRGDTRVRPRSCVFYNLFGLPLPVREHRRAEDHARSQPPRARTTCVDMLPRANGCHSRACISINGDDLCYAVSRILVNASVYRVLDRRCRSVCWLCAISVPFCTLSHCQNVIDLNLLCRNRV